MKKSEKKDISRPRQLEQRTGPVEVNDVVSFDQAMGRVVDGEPLPGDELVVIQHLRSQPQYVQQIKRHLAIDAMLFDEARCDSRAFVESVRVAIEAEETKSVFVRSVQEAIFGSTFGRSGLKCDVGDSSTQSKKWLGHSISLVLACSLLVATLVAGGVWNAAAIGEPVLVEVDRVDGTNAFSVGDKVDLRALVLPEGAVDLRLPSGVLLECQSPLMARFEHPMRLHLSQGRVDVDVGEEGSGFTVVTPVGEVVDLGTRFAVNASADGEVRVAVLSGQVELRSQKVGTVSLFDGEAVRLSGTQSPRRLHSVEIRNHGIDHARKDSVIHSVSDNVEVQKSEGSTVLFRVVCVMACELFVIVKLFDGRWTRVTTFPKVCSVLTLFKRFKHIDFNVNFSWSSQSRSQVGSMFSMTLVIVLLIGLLRIL